VRLFISNFRFGTKRAKVMTNNAAEIKTSFMLDLSFVRLA